MNYEELLVTDEELLVYLNEHLHLVTHGDLILVGLQISHSQFKTVSDFVNDNNVKGFTLRFCANAVDIAKDIVSSNAKLLKLTLRNNQIGDGGASSISGLLKVNHMIKNLILRDNQIGDGGASSIADSLKVNSTIQKLTLASNQIGDGGASSIADSLKVNSTLLKLNLMNNQIGGVGLGVISKALEFNRIITKVDLAEFNSPWIERNIELVKKFAKHLTEYEFDHKPFWSNLSYLNRCDQKILEEELKKLKVSDHNAVIKQYKDQQYKTVEEVMKALEYISGKFQKDQDNHDTWIGILPAEIIRKILCEARPGLSYNLAKDFKWGSLELNTNTSQVEATPQDDASQIVEILGKDEDA